VTEGPAHTVVYANAVFRRLQSAGSIHIDRPTGSEPPSGADLTPLLDQVFRSGETARDVILEPADNQAASCSCTVWPVPGSQDIPQRLVIEVRDVELIEDARARHRAIAERLLLAALREQDEAHNAVWAGARADFLAKASRELFMSLDENATRDTVRRLTLPRPGSWCIVDLIESNGAIHRLSVVHPDPARQVLARKLEREWPAGTINALSPNSVLRSGRPALIAHESDADPRLAVHDTESLRILEEIGFGSMLAVPLIVWARVQGAITFISREGDPPFTTEEIALAGDLAARCAMALDNARLYRESDMQRLAAELASQSKSEFLGSVSHELRTPLNAIGGYADLLQMGTHGPVTEKQQIALARIKANEEHLLTLITTILNFVRIEGGRMDYRHDEVPMTEALADVVAMLSGTIASKGLIVEGPRDASAVACADPDRVRQILMNLVMNAVKYASSDRGTLTLTCTVVDDTVVAHVADEGPGIPPEKLDTIFDPFIQLTTGVAPRPGDGVGLGLAISRDLARAMDGDLTVESTVGVGSRFTLTLPLARSGVVAHG
jgi:signal transduction histidine kinase